MIKTFIRGVEAKEMPNTKMKGRRMWFSLQFLIGIFGLHPSKKELDRFGLV
jgi:hypothetical protein